MNNTIKYSTLLILALLFNRYLSAQDNTVSVGSEETGAGGNISYSIGQIDYVSTNGTGGIVSEGLQQTYKLTVNLKYYLQGYYEGAGLMRSVLFNQGMENNPLTNNVDSVTIALHQATAPYAKAHSFTGLLQTNGSIQCVFPNANEGSIYYIVLKHRNAIETWSANPVVLNGAIYDFSLDANKAFGNNQVEVSPNLWALYSGDINQDENVDLADFSLWELDNSTFAFGHEASDINGDGNVDLGDVPFIELNTSLFIFSNHP